MIDLVVLHGFGGCAMLGSCNIHIKMLSETKEIPTFPKTDFS